MTTDFQRARTALGTRLQELRTEGGLTGRQLAARLGWTQSKISKLESGKQTATVEDLQAWAEGVGKPGAAPELKARLLGAESSYRSWRRQLAAGHRPRQDEGIEQSRKTSLTRAFESARIPGLLQTPDYARALLAMAADFAEIPKDTDEAVRARMRRQEVLYEPGKTFEFLIWEGALHTRVASPPVMAAQLDRLTGLIGLDSIRIGVIPLSAPLRRTPAHAFWIYDTAKVVVEMIHAELWLDDPADIARYEKAFAWLRETAVFDHRAQRIFAEVRATLGRR
ncbi:helix-turn-helix domain-containing protein [Streptacidiphilus fuscans]|uniref:Helix-turn-helix transcriptional regulator n=1 Tax=Streptacidiphilus fuscans TaxID=2789292 RepID=A0A931B3C5_9ACTN|nr:Scr1 family TA system antitoxin-like transcriptional regulator [Streptacidiphilus fuscans]MBF9068542.1 helix-turn-helix transcriptional regulator [Streptacidiphilus fuscans]